MFSRGNRHHVFASKGAQPDEGDVGADKGGVWPPWLLDPMSSTHNESRLAACPLSGVPGRVRAPSQLILRRVGRCAALFGQAGRGRQLPCCAPRRSPRSKTTCFPHAVASFELRSVLLYTRKIQRADPTISSAWALALVAASEAAGLDPDEYRTSRITFQRAASKEEGCEIKMTARGGRGASVSSVDLQAA
jgi:hypothetical protein